VGVAADAKATDNGAKTQAKSALGDVSELKDLVIAYAKQETVDPLRSLVRFVLWGVVGGLLIAIGAGLVVLAAVRAAQSEAGTHLHGSLTWVPYTGGLIIALAVAAIAVARIAKGGPR
jgi:hypothetical protein